VSWINCFSTLNWRQQMWEQANLKQKRKENPFHRRDGAKKLKNPPRPRNFQTVPYTITTTIITRSQPKKKTCVATSPIANLRSSPRANPLPASKCPRRPNPSPGMTDVPSPKRHASAPVQYSVDPVGLIPNLESECERVRAAGGPAS